MTVAFQPDYRRLLKTIAHEEPDRVPLADFSADTALKDKFMGRPVRTIADHVAFQAAAGFDFIYLRANYDYPGTSPVVSTGTPRRGSTPLRLTPRRSALTVRDRCKRAPTWTPSNGPIPRRWTCRTWSRLRRVLPPGLGIITGVGGVFTRTWMLMGYEHFSEMLADDIDFVAELAARSVASSAR